MRAELETIALIEKYLLNKLSDAETQAFTFRMTTDPNFKNDVELQTQLMQSLEHISIQQSIQNAQQTYKFWKLIKLLGFIAIPIIIALTTWYFVYASNTAETTTVIIPTNAEQTIQQHEKVGSKGEIIINADTISQRKNPKNTQSNTSIFAANFMDDPLERIPAEIFTISTKKDTIIETQNGMVFLIPENAFVDANQNVVTEHVTVTIKEAVTAETIMSSGLATLYNGKPLETGGMFFIEALKDGEKLEIHPEKEITADIPTQDFKEGMQLFDGEVLENKTVNWVNPKPLNTALIPQDIYSLNFYPPNYLDTLAQKGYDITDKKFTDSLYYSFGKMKDTARTVNDALDSIFKDQIGRRTRRTRRNRRNSAPQDSVRQTLDIVYDSVRKAPKVKETLLGLNPLKVKTIWNSRYQNTFIATKAFEERLQIIHQHCADANEVFDLYVKNLDRNLYEVDEMVATSFQDASLREQFTVFASQKLTNVAGFNTDISKLNAYYTKQQKVYRLALVKAQQKIDSIFAVDETYQRFSKQEKERYYQNELAVTTVKVAKDLHINLPRALMRAQTNQISVSTRNTAQASVSNIIKKEKKKHRYRAPIRTTGWKNIDRIISEDLIPSIKNRETTTIRNKEKTTTVSYSEYEITIENSARFDQLFVYLVPVEFNSFIRLEAKNDRFTYKLNDLLRYRVHCIAFVNDIPFYFEKTVRKTSEKVTLHQITTEVLREKLTSVNGKESAIETEISYQVFKQENKKIVKNYRAITKLKEEIEAVVFPCRDLAVVGGNIQFKNKSSDEEVTTSEIIDVLEDNLDDPISISIVENVPVFPGCETFESNTERKKCLNKEINKFLNKELNMDILGKHQKSNTTVKIYTIFTIDNLGHTKDIQVRASHPNIEAEVKRVIQSFPKMIPGKQKGKNVHIKYTMPIIYRISN